MARDPKQAPWLPGRLPLLGHLHKLSRDALGYVREQQARIGPVFWLDMGFRHEVLMTTGEEGFAVFKNRDTDSSHLSEFGAFLGRSMLVVDGDDHRRMRGASGSVFTPSGLTRARVGEIIAETLERHVDAWHGHDEIALVRDTKNIALEVIFRVMGIEVRMLPEWSRWYGDFMLGAINIPVMLPGMPAWRARKARRWLEREVQTILADARARQDHDSIVGALVHGKDEQGAGMSERELIDNLLILGFAGHETTASTMAWSMLHLARSPRCWDRLCEEANAHGEVPVDAAELVQRSPYAISVFRESLRLYPPVPFDSRHTHTCFEVAGYRIEPGTIVGASLLHISRDPTRYEQPDEWRPERWLAMGHKPTPLENCQFGGGPHFCLGYHMALLEGTMFLVHAARTLSGWGRRPLPKGPLPRPSYMPLTRPPGSTTLRLG